MAIPLEADVMTAQGDRAARDLAAGRGRGTARPPKADLSGLQQLQTAAQHPPANARAASWTCKTRIQAEQAMIANDQMRLQGLAMTQTAQVQLQTQRDQERAAAASQSRLSLYQSGFQ